MTAEHEELASELEKRAAHLFEELGQGEGPYLLTQAASTIRQLSRDLEEARGERDEWEALAKGTYFEAGVKGGSLLARIEVLEAALRDIVEGRGPYSFVGLRLPRTRGVPTPPSTREEAMNEDRQERMMEVVGAVLERHGITVARASGIAMDVADALASEGVGEREDRDWAFSGGWTDGGPLNDLDCKHCVAECTCRIAIPPNEQEAR